MILKYFLELYKYWCEGSTSSLVFPTFQSLVTSELNIVPSKMPVRAIVEPNEEDSPATPSWVPDVPASLHSLALPSCYHRHHGQCMLGDLNHSHNDISLILQKLK